MFCDNQALAVRSTDMVRIFACAPVVKQHVGQAGSEFLAHRVISDLRIWGWGSGTFLGASYSWLAVLIRTDSCLSCVATVRPDKIPRCSQLARWLAS